jgi:hypothetical protein
MFESLLVRRSYVTSGLSRFSMALYTSVLDLTPYSIVLCGLYIYQYLLTCLLHQFVLCDVCSNNTRCQIVLQLLYCGSTVYRSKEVVTLNQTRIHGHPLLRIVVYCVL